MYLSKYTYSKQRYALYVYFICPLVRKLTNSPNVDSRTIYVPYEGNGYEATFQRFSACNYCKYVNCPAEIFGLKLRYIYKNWYYVPSWGHS